MKSPKLLFSGGVLLALSACSQTPLPYDLDSSPTSPLERVNDSWQEAQNSMAKTRAEQAQFDEAWLAPFATAELKSLINQALKQNRGYLQARFQLEKAKAQVTISGALLWPSFDVGLRANRVHSDTTDTTSNAFTLSGTLAYELDVWGKLNDAAKQANLNYLAAQAQFQKQHNALINNVLNAWLNIYESEALLAISEQRLSNAEQNLAIIEQGYQQGLNSALDVYLARNELNSEKAALASRSTSLTSAKRSLSLLLGGYPSNQTHLAMQGFSNSLSQHLVSDISLTTPLPSDVIAAHPEIASSWYSLLGANAGAAFSQKQRYPSFNLSLSASNASDTLSDVLKADLGWSLLGNITAPIFQAGRLKANAKRAELDAKIAEQAYLDVVFNTFNEVEGALNAHANLTEQYTATQAAAQNAAIAADLSFEQYQSGLVSYTTVLDAQNRAYSNQAQSVSLSKQLLANRIRLHLALGGQFSPLVLEPTALEITP